MTEALTNEAVAVLQDLVRIDTVNPPGNERPAQEYLARLLGSAGLEVELVGPDPERPNLVARLRGRRTARCSACSPTWTRSAWTRPAGATTPGRGRSTTAACGAAARST